VLGLKSSGRQGSSSIAACLRLIAVGLTLAFPALADEAPPLRLCADPDNLPFSSANAAMPGFYIELGNEIARALGRSFQPVWVPTYYTKRQIRLKLLAGQCDGFVGVPDDPSFMGRRVLFSKPIVRLGYALVAPSAMAVNRPQDLHGRRVAVQFSSPPQDLLAGESEVQMVTVLSPEEAMQDLAEGKADAAFIWGASAGWLNNSLMHGAYRVVPFDDDRMKWNAAIAFPHDRKDLRDQVDQALRGLGASIETLSAKYGFPAATPGLLPAAASAGTPPSSERQPGTARPPAVGGPAVSTSADDIAAGRKLFNENCSHCHGPDAVQGEQRRNLRLLKQRYGDDMPQTFITTVTRGRPSRGMPNWGGIISADEFRKILAFLASVQEPGS
jgi:polar amino acid transport system substrate-binding protein